MTQPQQYTRLTREAYQVKRLTCLKRQLYEDHLRLPIQSMRLGFVNQNWELLRSLRWLRVHEQEQWSLIEFHHLSDNAIGDNRDIRSNKRRYVHTCSEQGAPAEREVINTRKRTPLVPKKSRAVSYFNYNTMLRGTSRFSLEAMNFTKKNAKKVRPR